ncbi:MULTISPECIES: hypothetical protein [Micromonospora]|uniref:Tat (Twin-arginine translocation) pathway signal sequence n=1 Tax=Micromonospora yangpuensis TaxID=683228 RepID=A0A1C6U7F2_9ACTN|nr:hypothetical protein [Micromonospora yangpuensis]GGL90131.1 hypothetical protein GCM10012279_04800 [Micromonospora yangpuensis]SCL49947.1 hypothetical protein GA0070617_1335 [Micromonospora yangpuensis]
MRSDQSKWRLPRLTRRQTLTAAASATLGAAALAVPGLSAATQNDAVEASGEPIIVHLRDAEKGTMDIFVGTSKVEVRDRGLADRLRRAAARR